ncbi:hypothetical protein TWF281_002835, partial [Arthrobotrys megalospora]
PSETALALHAIISSAVLVRHPKLRLCFAHAGGAYLPLLGRIQHGYDCRPDLVAHKSEGISPTQQIQSAQRNIWIDSLVHDPDLLEYICKKIGPERVVMGSDYPFPLGEVPLPGQMVSTDERVKEFLSEEKREAMLWGNAVEFLGLYDLPGPDSMAIPTPLIHVRVQIKETTYCLKDPDIEVRGRRFPIIEKCDGGDPAQKWEMPHGASLEWNINQEPKLDQFGDPTFNFSIDVVQLQGWFSNMHTGRVLRAYYQDLGAEIQNVTALGYQALGYLSLEPKEKLLNMWGKYFDNDGYIMGFGSVDEDNKTEIWFPRIPDDYPKEQLVRGEYWSSFNPLPSLATDHPGAGVIKRHTFNCPHNSSRTLIVPELFHEQFDDITDFNIALWGCRSDRDSGTSLTTTFPPLLAEYKRRHRSCQDQANTVWADYVTKLKLFAHSTKLYRDCQGNTEQDAVAPDPINRGVPEVCENLKPPTRPQTEELFGQLVAKTPRECRYLVWDMLRYHGIQVYG